jgi:hypothetical protein
LLFYDALLGSTVLVCCSFSLTLSHLNPGC